MCRCHGWSMCLVPFWSPLLDCRYTSKASSKFQANQCENWQHFQHETPYFTQATKSNNNILRILTTSKNTCKFDICSKECMIFPINGVETKCLMLSCTRFPSSFHIQSYMPHKCFEEGVQSFLNPHSVKIKIQAEQAEEKEPAP